MKQRMFTAIYIEIPNRIIKTNNVFAYNSLKIPIDFL
jgi:hypothetical protein